MSSPGFSVDPDRSSQGTIPVVPEQALLTYRGVVVSLVLALVVVCLFSAAKRPGIAQAIEQRMAQWGWGAAALDSLHAIDDSTSAKAASAQPGAASSGHGSDRGVPVHLNAEQTNLARYISTHYRHALEFSREVVHHAYLSARDARVDPLLVLAVISVESRFDPLAQSPAGAQGLMQVLTRVHFSKFQPFGGVQAAFDPVANLRVGTAILRHYLQTHDSVPLALKAYVGAAQAEHDSGYAAKVLSARERFAAIAAGRPMPVNPVIVPGAAPLPAANDDAVRSDMSSEVSTRLPVSLKIPDDLRAPDRI